MSPTDLAEQHRFLYHSSETTTQIYLRSIRTSEVDDANARILAAI